MMIAAASRALAALGVAVVAGAIAGHAVAQPSERSRDREVRSLRQAQPAPEGWTPSNEQGVRRPERLRAPSAPEGWTPSNEQGVRRDDRQRPPVSRPPASRAQPEGWTPSNEQGTRSAPFREGSSPSPGWRPPPDNRPDRPLRRPGDDGRPGGSGWQTRPPGAQSDGWRRPDGSRWDRSPAQRWERPPPISYAPPRWRYPPPGRPIAVLPPHAWSTWHGGSRYWYYHGIWYTPSAGAYVVVRPPLGIHVSVLPPYHRVIHYGPTIYYVVNDVYYVRADSGYRVVQPPADIVLDDAPALDAPIVYPNWGQTPERQAQDEYECHEWAVQRSGVDPSRVAVGQGGAALAEALDAYSRAWGACLEGRGYTVR